MLDVLVEREFILLDLGMPEGWAKSYARLYHAPKPASYAPSIWRRLIIDAGLFWDKVGPEAIRKDWQPVDAKNLFPIIRGRGVVKVGFGDVEFGDGERAYKRPVVGAAPEWRESRREIA